MNEEPSPTEIVLAPTILSIDTAGPACQVVLAEGEAIVSEESVAMLRGHGEALVPMVERVLNESGLSYDDLDRVAVTMGPGSFTGMRVGLAAARGFGTSLNIPVVGIGTLEALAVSDEIESDVNAVRCVALDARNGLVYGQRFDANGVAIDQPSVMADLVFVSSVPNDARLVGPTTPVLAALVRSARKRAVTLGRADAVPSSQAMAKLGARAAVGDKPRPLYLKAATTAVSKPAGLRT